MSFLTRLMSPCLLFGHTYPVIVMQGKVMRHICDRCHADLGIVLAGQVYRARKPPKAKKKKRSADILKPASWKAAER